MEKILESAALPVGILRIEVHQAGELIEVWEEKNLIVDAAKGVLASLLGGAVANKSITKVGFGTNGAQPTGSNTALAGAFIKSIDSVSYPTAASVRFNFSLGTSEANGLNIIEFGLFTNDTTLFSRRVRGTAIAKAADISFVGTWTISF